jgi:catalase (peroxidase I)
MSQPPRAAAIQAADRLSPADMLVDLASKLTLTVPEMTVLVGSLRVLNANAGQTSYGEFIDRYGTLTNDFFVNLLDMSTRNCARWRRYTRRPMGSRGS